MVIAAFVVVRSRAVAGVPMRGGLMAIGVIVGMSVVFLPAAALVMRERHALRASDCRHTLRGNGQGQQQHSKKAEERLKHPRAL
jgi:hypothetical protein